MSSPHPTTESPPQSAIHDRGPSPTRPWQMRVGFWLLIGIAAFFLFTEHHAHLVAGLRWLPLLVLLACPLIHMFSHGGHGGHGGHGRDRKDRGAASDPPPAVPGNAAPTESNATRPHSHGGEL